MTVVSPVWPCAATQEMNMRIGMIEQTVRTKKPETKCFCGTGAGGAVINAMDILLLGQCEDLGASCRSLWEAIYYLNALDGHFIPFFCAIGKKNGLIIR